VPLEARLLLGRRVVCMCAALCFTTARASVVLEDVSLH